MKKINWDLYKPQLKDHPYKGIFKAHGISQVQLANYLGVSQAYVTQFLNCRIPVSKVQQKKLDAVVKQLEKSEK